MDLQQLQQFVAVAEERHFTRAANRCHIAQSALSTSIRALERQLGTELFNRTTRRVELSEAGLVLLPEARRVLAAAESARDAVDECLGRVRGMLTIGRVWEDISVPLAKYHATYPEVQVTLKQGLSAALIEDVRSGIVDIAFAGLHPRGLPSGVRAVSRKSVPIGIACASAHRLTRHKKVGVKLLSGEVFVADPGDTASHDAVSQLFASFGATYEVAFRVADIPSMLDLVASGLAIALLPKTATESWSGIAYVPLAGTSPSCDAGVVVADRPQSVAVRTFLEILASAEPGIPQSPSPESAPPDLKASRVVDAR
jgi:DNA-binding transcriptional LysR family regulator